MYDFCTEALQQKLKENRQAADKVFTSSLETKPSATETDTTAAATTATAAVTESMDVDNQFEGVDEEEKEALMAALRMSMTDEDGTTTAVPAPVSTPAKPLFGTAFANDPNGLPAGFTGLYSLHSIVTHKGRSADSGHYIGWVRQADNPNFWWKYDDDEVSEVDTDEIMRLKGGGDKDMTYMVFYRYKLPNEN